MKKQTLPRQSAHIVDFLTILWGNVLKISEKKNINLVLLVLHQKKNSDRPARKCFRCGSEDHLIAKCPKPPKDSEKRRKSDKSKKKVIVRKTTAMMTMTLNYTHLWHKYLLKTNTKIKIMAIVRN